MILKQERDSKISQDENRPNQTGFGAMQLIRRGSSRRNIAITAIVMIERNVK